MSLQLRLTLTVDYDPNQTPKEVLVDNLLRVASLASGEGLMTGETDAEVGCWSADVVEVPKAAPAPLETRTLVVLSTQHLTHAMADEAWRLGLLAADPILRWIPTGFLMRLYPSRPARPDMTDELWAVCEYIHANLNPDNVLGAYVLFDRDGEILEALPTYDW